jgi:hypothetical protein
MYVSILAASIAARRRASARKSPVRFVRLERCGGLGSPLTDAGSPLYRATVCYADGRPIKAECKAGVATSLREVYRNCLDLLKQR